MLGCDSCGEAIVVDPNMDVGAYLRAARADGVRIVAATETRIHADLAGGLAAWAAAGQPITH